MCVRNVLERSWFADGSPLTLTGRCSERLSERCAFHFWKLSEIFRTFRKLQNSGNFRKFRNFFRTLETFKKKLLKSFESFQNFWWSEWCSEGDEYQQISMSKFGHLRISSDSFRFRLENLAHRSPARSGLDLQNVFKVLNN